MRVKYLKNLLGFDSQHGTTDFRLLFGNDKSFKIFG